MMKFLALIAVVVLAGCVQAPVGQRLDEGPSDFYVATAAGYRVHKFRDGDVECYVTEKVGYSGGGIGCVVNPLAE